jgi:hypothetical protein
MGRLDCGRHVGVSRVVQLTQDMPVIVRLDHVDRLAGPMALLAGNSHGQLGTIAGQFLELPLERRTLWTPRGISLDRLIIRNRDIRYGIHQGTPCFVRHQRRQDHGAMSVQIRGSSALDLAYPQLRGQFPDMGKFWPPGGMRAGAAALS